MYRILFVMALIVASIPSHAQDNNPFKGAKSFEIELKKVETGDASFYGGPKHHGHPMANGQIYNQESDSCAHKKLPFGTRLHVARAGGRSVICVVRDRGPFIKGRILDLSVRHARALGMIDAGVVNVTAERVE